MLWTLLRAFTALAILNTLMWSSLTLADDSSRLLGTPVEWMAELERQYSASVSAASADLLANADRFKADPVAYDRYLNTHMASLWDTSSTARALIGKSVYADLSTSQAQALALSVETTLRRYAFEGLRYYDDQTFAVHDVLVNKRGNRGWVQLVLRSKYLPDLYLDLMVKRLDGDRWVTIDVRVKGITYVGVKKNGFRELIEKESVTALIASLDSKNVQYFSNLCIKSDVIGEPPC